MSLGDVRSVAETVRAAWATVLGTEDIAPDDPFFDVGGDSASALRLHQLLVEAFPEQEISIVDVFRYPTIESLAAHLGAP